MSIIIFGKQSFTSKSGKQCCIIHYGFRSNNVEGVSVEHKFVSPDVLAKVEVNKSYDVVYGDSFGRSIIIDLVEVAK